MNYHKPFFEKAYNELIERGISPSFSREVIKQTYSFRGILTLKPIELDFSIYQIKKGSLKPNEFKSFLEILVG